MSWQEEAARAWVREVLSAFDTDEQTVAVILSGAAGPRSPKPYATVLLMAPRTIGEPDRTSTDEPVGDEYKQVITFQKQATLSVSIFGDSLEMMSSLEASLYDRKVNDANDARGIVVSHPKAATRTSRVPLETSFESRTQNDFVVRWVETRETTAPAVAGYELTSSLT